MFTDLEKLNLRNSALITTKVCYAGGFQYIAYDQDAMITTLNTPQLGNGYDYIQDPGDIEDPEFEAVPLAELLNDYYDAMDLGTSQKVFLIDLTTYFLYAYNLIKKEAQMDKQLITRMLTFPSGK